MSASQSDIQMKYGNSTLTFNIENAKSITTLEPVAALPINDLKSTFYTEAELNTVDSPPLSILINKDDLVTIVLSDMTRLWSRQDLVCKELVEFLHERCKVPYKNIVILISLGTHREQTPEENKKNVSDWVYDKVKVVNHNYKGELEYFGTTSFGTPVYLHPLTKDRKVIIVGATTHHALAGYGGGRKSIIPGVAGDETIVANHLLCMHPDEERSSDLIGMGLTTTNPVNVDMDEGVALLNPTFGINIIMNKDGKQSHLICGNWRTAWEKSCRITNQINGIEIEEKADIVIASCGGYPKDINLYQAAKTLFNMAEAVKPKGTLVLLAECVEGGGPPDFFNWAKYLKTNTLDKELRKAFTISGYIFYAACERIQKARTLAITALDKETLSDLRIEGFDNIDSLIKKLDFKNKSVILMPNGGSTTPIYRGQ